MKIEIKNVYGIKSEKIITIDSESKSNVVVFAPNGIGKTSLYKGLKDVLSNNDYDAIEENESPELMVEISNKKYGYDTKKINEEIIFIDGSVETSSIENIINSFTYDGKYSEKDISFNILNFWEKILKEFNEEALFLMDGFNDTKMLINKISKYLEKNETSDLKTIKKKLNIYEEIIKKINDLESVENFKTKTIGEYCNVLNSGKNISKSNENIILDVKIISDIKEQKKDLKDVFGYKKEDEYIPISNVDEEFMNKILNSYSKKEIELILLTNDIENLIPKTKNGKYNKNKGRLKSFSLILREEIELWKEKKLSAIIKNNKDEFLSLKKEYDYKTKIILESVNKKISNINKFLNKNTFDWKVNVENLNGLYEKLNIKILNENTPIEMKIFEKYASDGQKKILSLISSIIPFYNKKGTIVFDDAFTSLDNQHLNEFFEVINNGAFKNIEFIFLTHNFEWLRSASFNFVFSEKTKFFVLDKSEKNKYILIKGDASSIQGIMSTKNIKFENDVIKLITLANIAREVVSNNIFTREFPIKGLIKNESDIEGINNLILKLSNSEKLFLGLIEFCDQYIRHYKGNIYVKTLLEKFNLKVSDEIQQIPIVFEIKKTIEKISKLGGDNIFGDFIINKEIEWNSSSLEEYVYMKIFFGTKTRFIFEKNKYYKDKNKKVIKLWEDEERWALANKKIPVIPNNNYMFNYLAHANNIQWSKIIEFSIYKLKKMV